MPMAASAGCKDCQWDASASGKARPKPPAMPFNIVKATGMSGARKKTHATQTAMKVRIVVRTFPSRVSDGRWN